MHVVKYLSAMHVPVRVVSRSPRQLPAGVQHYRADLSEKSQAAEALAGASMVYGCVGLPYSMWKTGWEPLLGGMLHGCQLSGARFVFCDNLYMYGPRPGPLTEDTPVSNYGTKPAVRAWLTSIWQKAHADGRVMSAAVRSSDFYGPHALSSYLGKYVFEPAIDGGTAMLLGDVHQPHSFTFINDVARAMVTVMHGGDDCFGQAWHVPNAKPISLIDMAGEAFKVAGTPFRHRNLSGMQLKVAAMANREVKEIMELMYMWNKPFVVDSTKFEKKFWDNPMPVREGIDRTISWYEKRGMKTV